MNQPTHQDIAPPACTPDLWKQRRSLFQNWMQQVRWPAIALFLIALLIYAPVLTFQFLNWDDGWYIVRNDLIKSWDPSTLYRVMTEPVARNFAPATIGSFLMEHTAWELWPGGYHLTNVLIHIINALLVLQLMRQLTRNEWLAWMVAVLFVVHPVQVESVAWISSRKTLLSATWMLASCLCWLRPDRTHRDEAWGLGWLLLALLSKAAAVSIPPVVVAYDVLVARKKLSESLARQIFPIFFCVMLILTTMNAQVTIIGGVRGHLEFSKLRLLAIDLTLLWRYVGMLIYPQDLCVLYSPPVVGITVLILFAALAWGAMIYLLWRTHRTKPLLALAGIAWIMLFLPVLNLFPLTTLMNDRYLYLPCIPFFAVVCWTVHALWQYTLRVIPRLSRIENQLAAVGSAALIGFFALGTLNYLPVWRDPVSLWSYARVQQPQITMVQVQWAVTLEGLGEYESAKAALNQIPHICTPDPAEVDLIQRIHERIEVAQREQSATAAATAEQLR